MFCFCVWFSFHPNFLTMMHFCANPRIPAPKSVTYCLFASGFVYFAIANHSLVLPLKFIDVGLCTQSCGTSLLYIKRSQTMIPCTAAGIFCLSLPKSLGSFFAGNAAKKATQDGSTVPDGSAGKITSEHGSRRSQPGVVRLHIFYFHTFY